MKVTSLGHHLLVMVLQPVYYFKHCMAWTQYWYSEGNYGEGKNYGVPDHQGSHQKWLLSLKLEHPPINDNYNPPTLWAGLMLVLSFFVSSVFLFLFLPVFLCLLLPFTFIQLLNVLFFSVWVVSVYTHSSHLVVILLRPFGKLLVKLKKLYKDLNILCSCRSQYV